MRFDDQVFGPTEVSLAELDDFVIVRSNGVPLYVLSNVVDDHLMGITHVLRGDDHVSNTPFQILIYQALGWKPPKFGHMPMILGPDKKRLSKRHGAASVEEFRDGHWLSEAVVNYLALLGWSPGNDQEFFTVEQIIKKFSLKRLNNTAAVFDYEKARHLNGEHMKAMSLAAKTDVAFDIRRDAGVVSDEAEKPRLGKILELLGNRFSHFDRTVPHLSAYFSDDYPVDPEIAAEVTLQPIRRFGFDAAIVKQRREFACAEIEQRRRIARYPFVHRVEA